MHLLSDLMWPILYTTARLPTYTTAALFSLFALLAPLVCFLPPSLFFAQPHTRYTQRRTHVWLFITTGKQSLVEKMLQAATQKTAEKANKSLENSTSERRGRDDLFWLTNQWPTVFWLHLLESDQYASNLKKGWRKTKWYWVSLAQVFPITKLFYPFWPFSHMKHCFRSLKKLLLENPY